MPDVRQRFHPSGCLLLHHANRLTRTKSPFRLHTLAYSIRCRLDRSSGHCRSRALQHTGGSPSLPARQSRLLPSAYLGRINGPRRGLRPSQGKPPVGSDHASRSVSHSVAPRRSLQSRPHLPARPRSHALGSGGSSRLHRSSPRREPAQPIRPLKTPLYPRKARAHPRFSSIPVTTLALPNPGMQRTRYARR